MHVQDGRNGVVFILLSLMACGIVAVQALYAQADEITGLITWEGQILPEETSYVTLRAPIMLFLDQETPCAIVAEKQVFITPFKVGNKTFQTRLQNQYGRQVNLSSFNVGQRVQVEGYLISDGAIVAESIQALGAGD